MLEGVDGITAVFFGQPALREQPDATDVWAKLFDGAKPDAYNRNVSGPLPFSTAQGLWGNDNVQVTAQVGRIDLQWTRPPADEMGRPQQFHDVQKSLRTVVDALKRLAATTSPARLALLVNTSSKTLDSDPAEALSSLLGKVFFPPEATDAIYRLNLRRELTSAPNISLNRLSVWQTGVHQLFGFNPNDATPAVLESANFIAHNIDVNTIGILSQDREYSAVIDEMESEALLILEQGISFYG
ncbi:hypothetical protein [Novosphingobium kaempferiae]|uniref:hypothetical protein n=1 Tax=Novosphingobium kaempferiae TaxID=2896849 RepID=UPI001E39FF99|nr:hypothetical protein [Novosphingobium kaempferiae]